MKIKIHALLLFFLAVSVSMAFAEVKEMTFVCGDADDFPYVVGNGPEIDPAKPGVSVDAIKMVTEKMGIKATIIRLPWKRALEIDLQDGKADGAFTASYKKEREVFGVYPSKDGKVDEEKRFSTVKYVFYKKKGTSIDYDGTELKGISGNKIGAPRGYSIVEDLKKKGYDVEETSSTLTDLKKLSLGRVGAVAALEESGDFVLSKNPDLAASIEKIAVPISSKPYFFMFSHQFVKANPEVAEKIWNALVEIREKEYKKLLAKYLE